MHPVDPITRRGLLKAGLATLALPAFGAAPSSGTFRLKLTEAAGLRRFGYPVSTFLPEVRTDTRFRLTLDGRAVPAQFRKCEASGGGEIVALDFNASPGPGESQSYVVAFGDSIEPGPEPRQGMTVRAVEDDFLIENGPALKFVVPRNLRGFLKAVSNGRRDYLQTASQGLSIRLLDGRSLRLGGEGPDGLPMRGKITRQGSLAIGLRFDSIGKDGGKPPFATSLDLTFPSSKSWVETQWWIENLQPIVAVDVDLRLAIEGEPTLVDLGATSTVYGTLRNQERMILSAAMGRLGVGGHPWVVDEGPPDRLERFAFGTDPLRGAEGWAHVMDRTRCTALAIESFGLGRDRIDVEAGGRVRLSGSPDDPLALPPKAEPMHFWFHFVPMPVQVGAATSPQAMLAPLRVDWNPPEP